MKSPLPVALLLVISSLGLARADVARIAELKGDERIEVEMLYIGTVPQTTKFTFTADKVAVEDFGKKVGEVKLTKDERAAIDRHLDSVRKGRHGTGNGSRTYTIRLFRKDREKRGFREQVRISSAQATEAKVLSLHELKERAGK